MPQTPSDEVFLLSDDNLCALPARPMRTGLFGKTLEDALQTLLQRYPQVLPGRQIDPDSDDPPRFALLRREMPVGSWSLDHLYVDQRGVLTLVETKLVQNPEARREVVGQLLEYAANADASWGNGKARQLAVDYWRGQNRALDDVLMEHLGEDTDLDALWAEVEDNLNSGRLRLIIAADEIRTEVRRIIEYLNRELQNAEVLGLELACYGQDSPPQVLVPRLIGRVKASAPSSKPRFWSSNDLQMAYRDLSDPVLAGRLLAMLSWAEENHIFMPTQAKNPGFGLQSNTGKRLCSFSHAGVIFPYLTDETFAGTAVERQQFVDELAEMGLLDRAALGDEIAMGKRLSLNLAELDEDRLRNLQSVLLTHCRNASDA